MGMQINTNILALNAYRNLNNTQSDLAKSLEKLSSGLRINRAADDAAGLAISESLKSQVNGVGVAGRNARDAISVVQTAEGQLTEVHSVLQRMRDLAVQAGNDSNNEESRAASTTEYNQLLKELGRISGSANFNGIKLLDGTAKLTFQVGAGSNAANDQIVVDLTDASVDSVISALDGKAAGGEEATPGEGGVSFKSAEDALKSIAIIDKQITAISTARANLGAVQNRFESTIRSLDISKENLSAANSRIADTDMAEEMMKYTRSNILSQAGTAMLAQANSSGQGVLQLLR